MLARAIIHRYRQIGRDIVQVILFHGRILLLSREARRRQGEE
jgi:hypothetical protein